MQTDHSTPHGIWLPLITPFRDARLDETSLRRLLRHYAAEAIDGLILGATTGEGLTLDETELQFLVDVTRAELATIGRSLPVYLGLCGSDTRAVARSLHHTANWPVDGYLIACPYYTWPSEDG